MKNKKSSLENRRIRLLIGAVISLSIVWFAFEYKSPNKTDDTLNGVEMGVDIIDLIPITTREKKPEKPKPQSSVLNYVDNKEKTLDYKITVEVTTESIIEEPFVYIEDEKPLLDTDVVFIFVEEYPSFKGGNDALKKYIAKNLIYPDDAARYGIEGVVYVNFVVEKDGNITNVNIERGLGHGCDEEAEKLFKSMPKWNPGKQRDMPVNVRLSLPIKFKLK